MTTLGDLARLIRSKNAGPFTLTFDVMFDDDATYQRVLKSRVLTKERFARMYKVPEEDEFAERLDAVLAVIYLVFNEGYSASRGASMIRADLCSEAIRLCRDLVALLPREREAAALLALMLAPPETQHHTR